MKHFEMMVLKGGGRDQIRNESVGVTQKQFFSKFEKYWRI